MPEVLKYNLRQKLAEADEKYKNSPAVVGSSGMTFFPYNNSTRTNMLTSHMNQFMNSCNPEFPYVFTGMENVAGANSSGYKPTPRMKVYRKVEKFESMVEHPYVYQLFYWDYDHDKYDVIERKEVENLGQDFGYKYNNEKIDSLTEGMEVQRDEVLMKSVSYDESMNYRYGLNLLVGYTFDPYEFEDAATISEDVAERCRTVSSVKRKWGWNNNDVPLNIYGGDDEYRPLPWIGEEVTGIITSSRPQINEQLLYDFKHENLTMIRDSDHTIYYNGTGTVVDYEIFLNNPDIQPDIFNAQLLMLLDEQNRYWKKIQDTCLEIINSGKNYSNDIDLLYDRSMKFLERNPKRRWNNGSSVFGNVEIRIHIVEYPKLAEGGKFTARYGNKTVTARVLPRHLMPFNADGEHLQVLLAMPAVSNRTTGFVPHEIFMTSVFNRARKMMADMKTLKEKEDILWDLIKRLNVRQYEKMHTEYLKLTKKEKEAYMQDVIERGIYSHQDMILDDESVFFKLKKIHEELPWVKPDTLYVYRFGHVYRLYQQYWMGCMYFFPLKQTDKRGFSVRSTGAVNLKGLPERSYKNKHGKAPFSDTAIRFGEYDLPTMLIGANPDEMVAFEAMYRTSPDASKDLTKAQFDKACRGAFKNIYRSRPAEINTVYFKHLGVDPKFIDCDNTIAPIDSRVLHEHVLNGKTYLCTDYEFHCMVIKDRIRKEVMLEHPVITGDELEREIEERFKETPILLGEYDGHHIFDEETLAEPEVTSRAVMIEEDVE